MHLSIMSGHVNMCTAGAAAHRDILWILLHDDFSISQEPSPWSSVRRRLDISQPSANHHTHQCLSKQCNRKHQNFCEDLSRGITQAQPHTKARPSLVTKRNPWDLRADWKILFLNLTFDSTLTTALTFPNPWKFTIENICMYIQAGVLFSCDHRSCFNVILWIRQI